MMESSNLNLDLHHQEEFHASSSSLTLPSLQDLILNNSISLPMVQELGFQWGIDHGDSYLINEEDNYEPKCTNQHNMKEFGININLQDQYGLMPSHVKHEFNQMNGFVETNYEPMCMDNINSRRGSLSMVLPSANVSTLNYMNPLYSASTLGMSHPSFMINNSIDLTRENNEFSLGLLQQESTQASVPTNNHKVSLSSVISGVTEAKRSSSSSTLNCKASQTAPKKPRFESRPSFTPFKVRKEKLGDRIAALQQLVSPFGKTDTASVLMEATGYIKFLQHQVETLSVPYMSNNKRENSQQEASSEEKRDLRSRGLCLVPLSCMSYVTNDNSGVWSPTNYRGGT